MLYRHHWKFLSLIFEVVSVKEVWEDSGACTRAEDTVRCSSPPFAYDILHVPWAQNSSRPARHWSSWRHPWEAMLSIWTRTCSEHRKKVDQFPRAAVTGYKNWMASNNKNVFSLVLETRSLKSRCQQVRAPSETLGRIFPCLFLASSVLCVPCPAAG